MQKLDGKERSKAMLEMYRKGSTLGQIAAHYGITRERVRQLLNRDYSEEYESLREERVLALEKVKSAVEGYLEKNPWATRQEIAQAVSDVKRTTLKKAMVNHPRIVNSRAGKPTEWTTSVSDEDLIKGIQETWKVAQEEGHKHLSAKTYDALRSKGLVTSQTHFRRFGSWREACIKAGVPHGAQLRVNYEKKFTRDEMIACVKEFIEYCQPPTYPTADLYNSIASDLGYPSLATLRNNLGTWMEIRRLAQEA